MKSGVITAFLFFAIFISSGNSQTKLTIYYFGATSCGPCNRPEVVESIKEIKKQFGNAHPDIETKFVMVSMDTDIEKGIAFIKKYGYWDEISVGSHFNNELALSTLNKTDTAAVPHILIYKDAFENTPQSVLVIKNRILIKEILGGTEIVKWANEGLKLD